MVIRDEQLLAMSKDAASGFTETLAEEVRVDFPERTRRMSEEQLREVVQSGIDRADKYGIDQSFDVKRFVQLMFRFPSLVFEEDPACPWAKSILEDPSQPPESKLDDIEGHGLLLGILEEQHT